MACSFANIYSKNHNDDMKRKEREEKLFFEY